MAVSGFKDTSFLVINYGVLQPFKLIQAPF